MCVVAPLLMRRGHLDLDMKLVLQQVQPRLPSVNVHLYLRSIYTATQNLQVDSFCLLHPTNVPSTALTSTSPWLTPRARPFVKPRAGENCGTNKITARWPLPKRSSESSPELRRNMKERARTRTLGGPQRTARTPKRNDGNPTRTSTPGRKRGGEAQGDERAQERLLATARDNGRGCPLDRATGPKRPSLQREGMCTFRGFLRRACAASLLNESRKYLIPGRRPGSKEESSSSKIQIPPGKALQTQTLKTKPLRPECV